MSLEDILSGQQWAIRQEVLDGFVQLLDAKGLGGDLDAIAAKLPGAGMQKRGAQQQGKTAVIPVDGTLSKRTFLFDCGSTYAGVRDAVQAALDDPSITAILLDIDSPGGTVSGVAELADFVAQANKLKPVHAYTDGQMTSAAYWLASAARSISAASTASLGSIGVLSLHTDRSGRDAQAGVKRTFISAGSHKTIGNDAAPLDDKALGVIQGQMDKIYSVFVETVAANRGLNAADAEIWADGKVFLAADAKALGLIDEVSNRDNLLAKISSQEALMDLKQLKAEHSELVSAIVNEATKTAKDGMEKAQAEAVGAEQARIIGLAKVILGEESGSKLEGLAKSGMTSEMATAAKDLLGTNGQEPAAPAPQKPGSQAQAEALKSLKDASAEPVKPGAAQPGGQDFVALVAAYQKDNPKASKAEAMAHVVRTNPEAHQTYIAQVNAKGGK